MSKAPTKAPAIAAALGDNMSDGDANMAVTDAAPEEARITIMLEESEAIPPTGQFFGVNGKGFMLRAGEEASVPISLVHVLDSAVESVPVLDQGQRVIAYRNKLRFPYRIITETRTAG